MDIIKASLEDLEGVVNLHIHSFKPEEHVPMMLGKNYVKATYKWLITSDISYVLVAKKDNKILGLVAVCDTAFTKPMFFACLPEFFLSILSKPTRLFKKNLWKRLFRKPNPKNPHLIDDTKELAEMTIGAVDAEARGLGVFGKLIHQTTIESFKRGSKGIRAGIYKWNNSSQRVFIKNNWDFADCIETDDTVFFKYVFKNKLNN